jgi:trehalose 6-phosphate phosphatase
MSTVDELIGSLRGDLGRTLIALDFDGTLAPIVADPSSSRPVDGTAEVLTALAGRGATIAVITGRDAHTVLELSGLADVPGLIVEGIYGAEQWRDGELTSPSTPDQIAALREELPTLLSDQRADPKVWIEDKRLSLVVHGRLAEDPEGVLAPLQRPVAALATRLGFEVHSGRGVIELRLPGFDKGTALTRLIDQTGAERVVFAGDDVGDLPAFYLIDELRRGGHAAWSVAVASADVPELDEAADVSVSSPAQLVELLRTVARG